MTRANSQSPQRGDISPDERHYWDGDVWQWQPFWLVPDEVVEAIKRQFGRTAHTVSFLAAGMLNQSWRIDTHDGSYVLRISRWERSRPQIAYEHEFLRQLASRVDEVVAPLAGNDGETTQFRREHILSLFPFVEGVGGEAVGPDVRCSQSATMLARLHQARLDDVHLGQRPGLRSFCEEWQAIWHAVNPVLRRDLAGSNGFDELFSTLMREVATLEAWVDDLHASRRPLTRTTIHGDFNPRNLIFCNDRIVAVIDWDECRVDPVAWEVAQVGFGAPDVDPLAFWSAYRDAGGPLQPEDLDLMIPFAQMGALMELQWTVVDGQATPRAMDRLTGVAEALSRIGAIEIQL